MPHKELSSRDPGLKIAHISFPIHVELQFRRSKHVD